MKTTQNIAGGLEEGLESGIWGGVKGALIGYMTLPVVAGVAAGFIFAGGSLAAGLLIGAATTAAVAVLGYPLNKQIAKFGGLVGGVVGFTQGVDEPAPPAPTIQLGKDQELVVVNHAQQTAASIQPSHTEPPAQQINSSDAALVERLKQPMREHQPS